MTRLLSLLLLTILLTGLMAGELVVPGKIKFVRPETSLRPEDANKILGKKAVRTINAETALYLDDVVSI